MTEPSRGSRCTRYYTFTSDTNDHDADDEGTMKALVTKDLYEVMTVRPETSK